MAQPKFMLFKYIKLKDASALSQASPFSSGCHASHTASARRLNASKRSSLKEQWKFEYK